MNKKVFLGFAVICVMLMSLGYAIGSLLLERTITGSVTISAQPDLYVLGADGKALTSIDFGTLSNGQHLTASIRLANMGNTPLTIHIDRTDSSAGISSAVKRSDDTPYDNAAPDTLQPGESLTLKLELFNTVSLSAGTYPISFKVTGS